jgi:hypothetical protein
VNNKNENISDIELSLISAISGLDNKLEELDHNNQYLKTLPTKGRFSSKKKGYVLAESLRLKRIESIEKSLNTLLEKYGEAKISSENSDEVPMKINSQSNHSDVLSSDEFYLRSRGIFFGFLFSILLVLLLIVVSTGINIFI